MKPDNGVLVGELPEHTAEGLWVVLVENDHCPLHVPCGLLVLNPHNILTLLYGRNLDLPSRISRRKGISSESSSLEPI